MKVGISIYCTVCGRRKAPRGRSVPDAMASGLCTMGPDFQCPGYDEDPRVGSLWPGETEEDFGYPVGSFGTVERVEGEGELPYEVLD